LRHDDKHHTKKITKKECKNAKNVLKNT